VTSSSYLDAFKLLDDGRPACFIVASDVPRGHSLPDSASGESAIGHHRSGQFASLLIVDKGIERAIEAGWLEAEKLATAGARVVVCELAKWDNSNRSVLNRCRAAEEVLVHPANLVLLGVLNPVTETLGVPGNSALRIDAETRSMNLLSTGDTATAGFVLFEIDEPAEMRLDWLAGLVQHSHSLLPASPGIAEAVAVVELNLEHPNPYPVFEMIRSEILGCASSDDVAQRALYVAELSVKVVHNMWLYAHAQPGQELFDRSTGWHLLDSALYKVEQGPEHERWMELLFPAVFELRQA